MNMNDNTAARYTSSFPIQPQFVSNNDFSGDHVFTQLKRSGSVCVYRRNRMTDNKVMGYEVIIVRHVKAGQSLPGGNTVQNDYEAYPGAQAFGKMGWFFNDESLAEIRFDELVKEQQSSVVVPVSPILVAKMEDESQEIPIGEFTQAQFALHNCMPVRGVVYNILQTLIVKGIVKVSKRIQLGAGRPTVMYIKS